MQDCLVISFISKLRDFNLSARNWSFATSLVFYNIEEFLFLFLLLSLLFASEFFCSLNIS